MARERREVWAKRVERWVDSGLSAKEFAAEVGVKANTLAHWRWSRPPRVDQIAAAARDLEGFLSVRALTIDSASYRRLNV